VTAHLETWSGRLKQVASRPLDLCPDFPDIARRWERWWNFDADRPLLCTCPPKGQAPRWDKAFDLVEDPPAWLAVMKQQVANRHWVGEAIPNIRLDIGPVSMAAFLGAPLHFAVRENTTWQDPVIEQWTDDSIPDFDPGNRWFRAILELAEYTAGDAAGNYLVTLPDLTGAIDAIANMRGTQDLLMDVLECPESIARAADRVVDAWEQVNASLYETVTSRGAGLISWLLAWSDVPYTLPTCDFNFMIGPDAFREICLPSLVRQARIAGRCLFHLDGPGASRHAEALAEEPAITAIQYTPGAGTPSALAKLDMLKMIQSAGKPLLICPPAEEVPQLVDELDPRGLVIFPGDIDTPEQADELLERVEG